MPSYGRILVLCFLMLLTLNCGGTKSSGSGASKPQSRYDFGRSTTVQTLKQTIAGILHKYNHNLQISDNLLETKWSFLTPTESEERQGIKEIRYKLTVTISARRNISSADLHLQYDARYETGDWEKTRPSQEMVDFIKIMQNEVKQELQRYITQW